MLATEPLRVLGDEDLRAATEVIDRDPVGNVFVAARVAACGLDSSRLGAQVWGYLDADGEIRALCYSGANLVPVGANNSAARVFAEHALRQGRRCSSLVGEAAAVGAMWSRLEPHWGRAREVRARQPLLATDQPSRIAGEPRVRRVRPNELDVVLPACVAMFTEEVGVSPTVGDGGALYRARVREIVEAGRAFALIEDGQVLFKAEVGAVTPAACQVQGVWVDPARRGDGLGSTGMATVVDEALRSIAPRVSLYVNDFNTAARRAYDRVGFRPVGTFMSVLF